MTELLIHPINMQIVNFKHSLNVKNNAQDKVTRIINKNKNITYIYIIAIINKVLLILCLSGNAASKME